MSIIKKYKILNKTLEFSIVLPAPSPYLKRIKLQPFNRYEDRPKT